MDNEKTDIQKRNYERMIFAIAVLYSDILKMDLKTQDDYQKLTEAQKTYAKKIYDENPSLKKQVMKEHRISEETLIKDTQRLIEEDKTQTSQNGVRFARWVCVGDDKTCVKCAPWDGKIIVVEGSVYGYPTVDDVIRSGALHYGCRCALQELPTDEIPLKQKFNPRYSSRAQARPDLYNNAPLTTLVFN